MSLEDKAQDTELAEWEAINRPRPMPREYKPEDAEYGPEECDTCEEPMPPERRASGRHLCVACQTLLERRSAKLGRR